MKNDSNVLSLKKYLSNVIDDFRKDYEKLSELERKYLPQGILYSTPCQIEIFWIQEPSEFQIFILFHDLSRPDKEIVINGPFDENEIAEKVIEIMDESRWKKKAPYTEDVWFPTDIGDREHKYSDEFAGHFSHFLNLIRQSQAQYFPPGVILSYGMGETDFCGIFKGNLANIPSDVIDQKSSIEFAKQQVTSIQNGLITDDMQTKTPVRDHETRKKLFGAYYNPGVRIGDNVELTFREKITGPNIFEYPKYEYEFTFNGQMGFYDRYGLVIVESSSESEAIKILNTIFGVSIIQGIDAFSIRKSDVLITEIPLGFEPSGKPLGSYSRKISEITGQVQNVLGGLKRTQISFKKMQEIIRISERVFQNKQLNESLLFLLESNTHLKNSEFSQSYIFSWLIIEQFISKKFSSLLSEKPEIQTKLGRTQDPNKMPNSRKVDLLHSNKKLNDQDFSFFSEYAKKRNNLVHSGKSITKPNAELLFEFAFEIIQDETADMPEIT